MNDLYISSFSFFTVATGASVVTATSSLTSNSSVVSLVAVIITIESFSSIFNNSLTASALFFIVPADTPIFEEKSFLVMYIGCFLLNTPFISNTMFNIEAAHISVLDVSNICSFASSILSRISKALFENSAFKFSLEKFIIMSFICNFVLLINFLHIILK